MLCAERAYQRRYRVLARGFACAVAALTGDDHVRTFAVRYHHDWLQDSVLLDTGSQLCQAAFVEMPAWLVGICGDTGKFDVP